MYFKSLFLALFYYTLLKSSIINIINKKIITDCIIWNTVSYNYDLNFKIKQTNFYGSIKSNCELKWRHIGYDVIPPFPPYLYYLNNKPICKDNDKLYFLDNNGNCNNKFGNYEVLLIDKKIINCDNNLNYKNILKKNYKNFITEYEKKLFFSVTNYEMDKLFYELYNTKNNCLIKNVLSKDRFVNSFYNNKGLHIFRIILADSIYQKSMLKKFNNNIPKIYNLWKKNGFLILDYEKEKYYLKEILQNISLNSEIPQNMNFVKKSMIHQKKDHQYKYHMDTFHSIIKMWIYESDMKLKNGPLHFVKGSNNNDLTKLKYIFNVTKNNDISIINEPSIRLKNKGIYNNSLYLPILPLENSKKTLIIADTSGFHCRGYAKEGTERNYWRPGWKNNDGGLHRINFFIN